VRCGAGRESRHEYTCESIRQARHAMEIKQCLVCVSVDVRAMIRGGHPPAPILAGLSDGHGHTVTLSTSVIKKQISDSSTALYRIDHSCLRRN
jgi:hypothetical protein